jgi:hypothetical protein
LNFSVFYFQPEGGPGGPRSPYFTMSIQPPENTTGNETARCTYNSVSCEADSAGNLYWGSYTSTGFDDGTPQQYTPIAASFDINGELRWSKWDGFHPPASAPTYNFTPISWHHSESSNHSIFYAMGIIIDYNNSTSVPYITALDPANGNQLWEKIYSPGGSTYPEGGYTSIHQSNVCRKNTNDANIWLSGYTTRYNNAFGYAIAPSDGSLTLNGRISGTYSFTTSFQCQDASGNRVWSYTGGYSPGPNTPVTPSNGMISMNEDMTSITSAINSYTGSQNPQPSNYGIKNSGDNCYGIQAQTSTGEMSFFACSMTNVSSVVHDVAITDSTGWLNDGAYNTSFFNNSKAIDFDTDTNRMYFAYGHNQTTAVIVCYDFDDNQIVWQKTLTGNTNTNGAGTENQIGPNTTYGGMLGCQLSGDNLIICFNAPVIPTSTENVQAISGSVIIQMPKDGSADGDIGGYTLANTDRLSVGAPGSGTYSNWLSGPFNPSGISNNYATATNFDSQWNMADVPGIEDLIVPTYYD